MGEKLKILFVDDEKSIREIFHTAFQDDYDVYLAADGDEALKMKSENGIKLIYTDLQMPNMNGLELCRKIREHDTISVICAVTGFSKLFELQECREYGFDDYFKKPVDLEEISRSIAEAGAKFNRWFRHRACAL